MANFSSNAKIILESRYLLKDKKGSIIETPDELLLRVAKYISSIEKNDKERKYWENKYLSIMDTLEFLPNTPTLINAGKKEAQLSACFVMVVPDSIEGIFETVKQTALIHKSGGGTGLVFSHVRPKDSIVRSTSGISSGVCSFMKCFDVVTEVIKQGGVRRGANIAVLKCSHPEIQDYIKCKSEIGSFQNFNISVSITDNFMKAVQAGAQFPLRDPFTKQKTYIDASKLFDEICYQAWLTGDPGIIFIDTMNSKNPTPWLGEIEGVNPCVTGDTLVAVADGRNAISIKQLADEKKEVPIYCADSDGYIHIRYGRNPRITGYNKPIYKVILDDGSEIKATGNHKFILRNGGTKAVKELNPGDSLLRFDKYQFFYGKKKTKYWGIQKVRGNLYQEHRLIMEFRLGRELKKEEEIHHYDYDGLNNNWGNIVETSNHKEQFHDISGENNPIFKLKKSGKFNEYKDRNSFYNTKGGNNPRWRSDIDNSRILELRLQGLSFQRIAEEIGCSKYAIRDRYKKYCLNHKVVSVEYIGCEDVYNITVDEFHNYVVITTNGEEKKSGIIVKNCGENPLLDAESCNLGSIDVSKFVLENGKFNWDRFEEVVDIAIRFLDDVIDINCYPNVKIERRTKLTRKIGLGIMGWADCLMKMSLRYDSIEALKFAKRMTSNLQGRALITSKELAREKGACPAFLLPEAHKRGDKNLRRNATLTTIAPTGGLSIIADCSSGIEPLFSKSFSRTVLNGVKLDYGEKYKNVDSKLLSTALEISPSWHVKIQAAFQEQIDNAVSKTVNLPNSASVEDIKKLIFEAHSLGCKGLTVFRDGIRQQPLESNVISECEGNKCIV